jgi:hypothetical protein
MFQNDDPYTYGTIFEGERKATSNMQENDI